MAASDSPRVTLADIAARTGYSRALVSIVMRDAPGASAATRERIQATARELGYRPDARARSLAGTRSWSLGVLFGVAHAFHLDLIDGLYDAAERSNYGIQLAAMTRRRGEERAIAALRELRFDGLIMLGQPGGVPVLAGHAPVAVIGWQVDHPGVDSVRHDDDAGMELAVAHLAELGHTRIAHIDGDTLAVAHARRAGFEAAMRRHGLADGMRVVQGGQDQLAGQRAAQRLLAEGERPTAVICFNDMVAVAAISVFRQDGLDVPGDISVIGWDDTEAAALSSVPLTAVAQQPTLLAELTVERLLRRIEGGHEIPSNEIVLPASLTVRASTGPAPR